MNCIIVDDEKMARVVLNTLCNQIKNLNVVSEFSNAIQAIKFLNSNEVDLIFSDIHMPDFNGLDFIKTLKNPPKIILTSSDPNFAIEAFEYDFIVDYLLKPIELSRFEKAIIKAQNYQLKTDSKEVKSAVGYSNDFYINIDRRLIKIDLPSIYLVEAKGDYINIKTDTKNYLVHSTLKKIEEKLPDSLFLKIHRSYIINLKKIIDIEDNSVLIKRDVIPVSRSKRPELMKRLNLL
ncbi:LytR/AlgR family response regulator transcription factor [Tenacibaculum dicentrarchi]|uniref:LytR family transcriptional regulator n=1 Tax=Tenacibaculum dicentrarchi TaxID=669041 RepID=A0ABM9NWY1_9FLAO|nr:LytTR family DNA-binding domain-containing protein [Tenacibaculum dicentrarchi]MCD8407720.1 LytTR family DNA-binding domain-containing protein [Tenacibaculum dicentrarchi]MCD8425117.1 LytTR family DNA-binding domain-containing protein [Tenacibaculum dicentrarchi]MCD8435028.1 LytTR family DNA-binding domain-containing protein [Tenacibaculum dicentrarchi]MCD8442027.1 LytTR family DNA-binding domain-containing protein [Tenacibaculum dicentrarchi]